MVRTTRSSTASMPRNTNMTLEEQFAAAEREARREAIEQHLLAQKAREKYFSEQKAREQEALQRKTAEQEAIEQQALEEQALEEATASQTQDINQDASGLDTEAMQVDVDADFEAQLHANSTLGRLQIAGREMVPDIVFPMDRIFPKVAVFLRCLSSHIFALPGHIDTLALPDDSHAIAQIMAPCPQCVPAEATTEVFCKRKCPFCMLAMPQLSDGRYVCLSHGCWFGRSDVECSTDKAASVWKEVWRKMGNRYFFVGPWEEVLTFSNDFDRDSPDHPFGGGFTV